MFAIKDLTNPREFIAKLNSKLSNLFDGKYSSLSGVPTEFPPEEHIHSVVTNLQNGFISVDELKYFFDFFRNTENRENTFSSDFLGNIGCLSSYLRKNNWESNNPDITKITAADFSDLLLSKYQYNISESVIETGEPVAITIHPYTHNIIDLSPAEPLGTTSFTALPIKIKIDFSQEQQINKIACLYSQDRSIRPQASSFYYSVTPLVIPISFTFDIICDSSYSLELNPVIELGDSIINNIPFCRAFFYRCDYNVGSGIKEVLFIPTVYVSKSYMLTDGGYSIVQPYTTESGNSSVLLSVRPDEVFYPDVHYPNYSIRYRRITISGSLIIRKNIGANDDVAKIIPVAEFIIYNVS